jgi:hypothetical protein
VWTNFTDYPNAGWSLNVVASGPTATLTTAAPFAPGVPKLRINVPGDRVYDCWNFRGDCPFLLRNEILTGSYAFESLVETDQVANWAITGLGERACARA